MATEPARPSRKDRDDCDDRDDRDAPRDCCGVVGIAAREIDVARTAFFALYALQHRGQESAGIATSDGVSVHLHRGMGRVASVFDEAALAPLAGALAIGHTRYSTSGVSHIQNAQPFVRHTRHGPVALAHNGNLTNQKALRAGLLERGAALSSGSDTEVLVQMLAEALPGDGSDAGESSSSDAGAHWLARLRALMARIEGAYSLAMLTREAVWGVRDPLGFRPLCIGRLEGGLGHVLASESCALESIGATFEREVEPGEIVRLGPDAVTSFSGAPSPRRALCVFEHVYLARPDSRLDGASVHLARQRMGAQLWREAPLEADVVVAVPDSARSAALGFARASGIRYDEGLTKNRYVGRTFIQPSDRLRKLGVALKYNPLSDTLGGQRVVLVDDSIVRGHTAGPLVKLLRRGGAREVHVRISSPPIRHPCFMGVDIPSEEALIAWQLDTAAICARIEADSLAFLSVEGLLEAVGAGPSAAPRHCTACFTGDYPLRVRDREPGAPWHRDADIVEL